MLNVGPVKLKGLFVFLKDLFSCFSASQREASRPSASSTALGSACRVLSITRASGRSYVVSLAEGASWPVRNRRST